MKTLATLAILLVSAPAFAQDSRFAVVAEAGVARTWDDESLRGQGLLTGLHAAWLLGDKTSLELGVTRIPHFRRFEFSGIETDGVSWLTSASLKYDWTRGRVRPFVKAGYGINRHRGRWSDGPERTSTGHGYHAGLGLAVNQGRRLQHAVEGRVHLFNITDDSSAASILAGTYSLRVRF